MLLIGGALLGAGVVAWMVLQKKQQQDQGLTVGGALSTIASGAIINPTLGQAVGDAIGNFYGPGN